MENVSWPSQEEIWATFASRISSLPPHGQVAGCLLMRFPRSGLAGRPEEYFWTLLRDLYKRDWQLDEPLTDEVLLRRILREGTTPNGVFGAKVHWLQFPELIHMLQSSAGDHNQPAVELLSRTFPSLSVVWLQRLDRVGQAISWYRALATGTWWQMKGERGTSQVPRISLDVRQVAALERRIAKDDAAIGRFVAQAGFQVVPVTYEALVSNFADTIRAVLADLGITPPETIPPTALVRQTDDLTHRWRGEYVRRMTVRRRPSRPPQAATNRRAGTSVVIVSHNEGANLPATVSRLAETTPPETELIVVDDHSTDGSTVGLGSLAPHVAILRPRARLGVAAARNFGASAASGSVLVFSDAHVDPRPGWLSELRQALEDPGVGEVDPAVRDLRRGELAGYGFTWPGPGMSVHWLGSAQPEPTEVPFICGFLPCHPPQGLPHTRWFR